MASPASQLVDIEYTCIPCRAGTHGECSRVFAQDLPEGIACCCQGNYSLREHELMMRGADIALAMEITGSEETAKPSRPAALDAPKKDANKGDSGYIHPDAWPSSSDIGHLSDPESTGRKRQARMYPISVGQVCEWAGKKNVGRMPRNIIGCHNNPATDLHHGPDKNTLNNEKASWGIGTQENTHIICSECHNSIHAANDELYPAYDRVEQQRAPWLPIAEVWDDPEPVPASFDELMTEEKRRFDDRKRRGRKSRGRNSKPRGVGDFGNDGDDELGDSGGGGGEE